MARRGNHCTCCPVTSGSRGATPSAPHPLQPAQPNTNNSCHHFHHSRLNETRVPQGLRFRTRTCTTTVNAAGKTVVTGGPCLKESQAYTRKFGRVVASLFIQHYRCKGGPFQPIVLPLDMQGTRELLRMNHGDDAWPDSQLQGVEAFLRMGKVAP